MRRQFIYLVVNFLVEVILLYAAFVTRGFLPAPPLWALKLSAFLFSIQGYMFALIRLTDPPVYKTIKMYFSSCGSADEDHYAAPVESSSSFLMSQLNVELVYTILTGIVDFTENPYLLQVDTSISTPVASMTISSIKIKDFKFWENRKKQDFVGPDENSVDESIFDQNLKRSASLVNDLYVKRNVRISSYFPKEFQQLRADDKITDSAIIESLFPDFNTSTVFKAGEASGASGSFFFFSHDKKFIIKTMTSSEMSFFKNKISRSYFQYLNENTGSLLARIYGIYTVHMAGYAPVDLILMAHTLQISGELERVFDLKGSWVNRRVNVNPREKTGGRTLKDDNFSEMAKLNTNLVDLTLLE